MKFVIILKNKLENLYKKSPRFSAYVGKLVLCLCCLLVLRANCGYNMILSNIWIIIVISVFCSFAPLRLLAFILVIYTMIQMFALSIGVGVVCSAVLLVIYLFYYRFNSRYVYLMLLIPLFSFIKLVILLPLVLAVVGSADTVAIVVFGYTIYYMIRYVSLNAAIIGGMSVADGAANLEYMKMSYVIKGVFTDTEFLINVVILAVVFFVVYYMKRQKISQANVLSITAGSGIYIILSIASALLFDSVTLSAQSLFTTVAGAIVSAVIAAVIVYALLPLDYMRTENFEYEDDEYHYYVRAVPKVVIKKESVKVKKINSRKEIKQKDSENTSG